MKKENKLKLKKIVAFIIIGLNITNSYAASMVLSQIPLFLTSNSVPNVMIIDGNSNSMDEQADGQAVGSASPVSKSEISRNAIKNLVNAYKNKINMGLTGYAQTGISLNDLSNAPYDVSYNPANYDPTWVGSRTSSTHKKFRIVNPSDTSKYIYYNVALPGYGGVQSDKNNDTLFCYTSDTRSKAFANGEVIINNNIQGPGSGPWLSFDCYLNKNGTIDAGPTSGADNNAPTSDPKVAKYSNKFFTTGFSPTDSDLAQGITNYGNQLFQNYAAPAWFSQTPVGYGYVHIPIAPLDNTQANKILTKLGTAQFTTSGTETNPNYPLVNAGLSPIAGTVDTVDRYYAGNLTDSNQGGTLPAPPNACTKNYNILLTDGLPSVLSNGNISYNPTALLNDLVTSVGNTKTNNNVSTYVVGFALPYGVPVSQLNSIATAGGTGAPFYANDAPTLNTALNSVFADIIARSGASSSVALNSGYISSGDKVYQAKFNSTDWSGDMLAIPLDASGNLPADLTAASVWRAGPNISAQAPSSRTIITTKASSNIGIPFKWPVSPATPTSNELDVAQSNLLNTNPNTSLVDSLGQDRLNFLRGDASKEVSNFRTRTYKLGDIVNSSPVLITGPKGNYLSSSYLTFKSTYKNRTPIIYVGANDGMLHGINANNGNEVLGFVPNAVFSNLNQLTSPSYIHKYFIDGGINVSDVQYGGAWHTNLVSSMGAGAQGIFSLDITNPATFSEANAANIVKFEYTNKNNLDVGNIQGAPSIIKLNNGRWAALFGNGWNNTGTGQSALMLVDMETGALIKELNTGSGSPSNINGLANPTAIDIDGNGTADYVYAGDLNGNVWKFDLTASSPSQWKVAYSGVPLFNTGKPITTQPEVTNNPNGGYMVLVGTGKYLEASDNSTTPTNTFYGLWDNGTTPIASSNLLQQQTITPATSSSGVNYRNVSTNTVNYSTQRGWYSNFPISGERSVTDPLLRGSKIIYSTVVPSATACSYGGTSWLMSVDYLNGSQSLTPTFDTNNDGVINASDANYSGMGLTSISSAPTILQGLGTKNLPVEKIFLNESSGLVVGISANGNRLTSSRTAWQQLIKN